MHNSLINRVGELFRSLKQLAQQADNNHAYRYVKLVETSTLKHECRYAKASHKLWIDSRQNEQTIEQLKQLRASVDSIIEQYELEQNQLTNKE